MCITHIVASYLRLTSDAIFWIWANLPQEPKAISMASLLVKKSPLKGFSDIFETFRAKGSEMTQLLHPKRLLQIYGDWRSNTRLLRDGEACDNALSLHRCLVFLNRKSDTLEIRTICGVVDRGHVSEI